MTSTGRDALWSFLFASGDCQLVNLKLMRGDSPDVTTVRLREEVHSALLQSKTSTTALENFPETEEMGNIDVRELAGAI
ncbi:hypothetical protein HJB86_14435 [Rhizobium sp. NZLR3b]|uniref:hypothetical protein n=1 Tax=Rhizobium sp. NZLR3b TaxID=2731101 RepID=UPI001C83DB30|nr:hypothetical protein [Rhizobium sp. NZLR3b]MBX5190104.1 hypothetical protein [Rhizobium sp. NZLR3b]